MRHLKILLFLACISLSPAVKAQEIFYQVVNSAKNIIDDPQADPLMLSIAQFKFTAMQYLCTTAIKRNGGQVGADFLNQQAYSMNHFVTSYLSEIVKTQNSGAGKQKEVMKKYWQASAEHPLFNDTDTETVNSFMDAPDSITPFSLDTDWEKADEAISLK
ncbi:MAG: hypothetical protein LUI09_03795 [Prevotellaceae bacterium]|nr:hypothetical protein [Prevotellaceae bacterium]